MAPLTTVHPASLNDKQILANLMQLHLYEISRIDKRPIGPDGLFPYPPFEEYWRDPERSPYLIMADGRLAGFALVDSHPATPRPTDFALTEFFVLASMRKLGVGVEALRNLSTQKYGTWQLSFDTMDEEGAAFWTSALGRSTNGTEKVNIPSDAGPRERTVMYFSSEELQNPPVPTDLVSQGIPAAETWAPFAPVVSKEPARSQAAEPVRTEPAAPEQAEPVSPAPEPWVPFAPTPIPPAAPAQPNASVYSWIPISETEPEVPVVPPYEPVIPPYEPPAQTQVEPVAAPVESSTPVAPPYEPTPPLASAAFEPITFPVSGESVGLAQPVVPAQPSEPAQPVVLSEPSAFAQPEMPADLSAEQETIIPRVVPSEPAPPASTSLFPDVAASSWIPRPAPEPPASAPAFPSVSTSPWMSNSDIPAEPTANEPGGLTESTVPTTPTNPASPAIPPESVSPTPPLVPPTPEAGPTITEAPVSPIVPVAEPLSPAIPSDLFVPVPPLEPPVPPVVQTEPVTPPVVPPVPWGSAIESAIAPVVPDAPPVPPVEQVTPLPPVEPVTPVSPVEPVTPVSPVEPVTPLIPPYSAASVPPASPVIPAEYTTPVPQAPAVPTTHVEPLVPPAPLTTSPLPSNFPEPTTSPVTPSQFEVYDSDAQARQADLAERFERLLKAVRTVRFHVIRKGGYVVSDVDLFVDKVEGLLTQPPSPQARQAVLDMVREARFHVGGRGGYQVADVDTFCDSITHQLSD